MTDRASLPPMFNQPAQSGSITIDAGLLQALWCYGFLHPITGVVYHYGTHQKALDDAEKALLARDAAEGARREVQKSLDMISGAAADASERDTTAKPKPAPDAVREALAPFLRVAVTMKFYVPESMPDMTFPRPEFESRYADEPRCATLTIADFERLSVAALAAPVPPADGALPSILLDINAVHWSALRLVIEWWDSLPPNLRQDIEGSGKEPGAIAAARSALPYTPSATGAAEPDDPLADLVLRFSKALLAKLKLAQANGRSGWERDDWEAACQKGLLRHIAKGDPRDVAAYCAFMWHHGWIALPPVRGDREAIARALRAEAEKVYMATDEENAWEAMHKVYFAAILSLPVQPGAGEGEWRTDLVNAPKDGSRILLFAEGCLASGEGVVVGHWYVHPNTEGWITDAFDCGDYEFQPTHWKSLDAPPLSRQVPPSSSEDGR